MKKLSFLVMLTCLTFVFSCCSAQKTLDKEFGFCKDDFKVIYEADDHGGFHGDGSYYLTLDCSENQEKIKEIIGDWNELPFTENITFIMYGGSKGNHRYGEKYSNSDDRKFPQIENGYYKALDRSNGEIRNVVDDLSYSSNNFTIAAYDSDKKIMYYFEFDS